jgi:hypothetical protein
MGPVSVMSLRIPLVGYISVDWSYHSCISVLTGVALIIFGDKYK